VRQKRVYLALLGLEVEHFGSQVASPCASSGGCTSTVLLVLTAAVTVVAEGASIAADLLVPCLLY